MARRPHEDRPAGLTHNPFAGLRPSGAAPQPSPSRDLPTAAEPPAPISRIVVRREKKGRGGKTVTRVTGLGPAGADLPQLARELKRALGCGASVDGTDVLLQGSMTERAAAWLEERFEVPVSIGN